MSQDEIEELCRQIGRISAHTPEKNRVLILLARPEAATKLEDSAAARGQHSAISSQLLNQYRKHAFEFDGL